ncbi:alkylphosphonate utilization protein [Jhaorihella thermophila]|nr:alkylphosphonate utilization protein [Jhaorihella thermophila]
MTAYPVSGGPEGATANLCSTCIAQIDGAPDPNHWRCLASSMWSEEPAVQVLAARMLGRLSDHDWARDLADQLWLDDETRAWADNVQVSVEHRDSNGAVLAQGDTVVLNKDLPVKGAGFTAKRGTAVRNISLVADSPEHIEGRVEGRRIVILTKFVKKR